MKNRRQIILLCILGMVVLLTALLVMTYQAAGVRKKIFQQEPTAIQLRSAYVLQQLGHAYTVMSKGNFRDSERILKQLLKRYPGHSMAMQLLGQLYYRWERYKDAEKVYRTMIRNNEFDAASYNNLGQVLSRQGCYQEAEECLLKSRELNPRNMTVYINLSVVYSAMNRQEEAREMFMEAHRQLQEKQRSLNPQTPGTGYE